MSEPILKAEHLGITFGGLKAVSDFNMTINSGELVGLIGPNGAGKTTVFNLLTGVYQPTEGEFFLDGERMNGKKTYQVVRAGIARTFQNIRLFGQMTVEENVLVAFNESFSYHMGGAIFRTPKFWKAEQEITEKKIVMKDVILYMSKRAEMTFSKLALNRVKISLYDVVKTTGELKDVFRFTYNGRRYDRLSLSEKIRAGAEVSELVKRLTGRNYPVFFDNMESVDDLSNIRPTSQMILAKCVHNAELSVRAGSTAMPKAA